MDQFDLREDGAEGLVTLHTRTRVLGNLAGVAALAGACLVLAYIAIVGFPSASVFAVAALVAAIWSMDRLLTKASVFGFKSEGAVTLTLTGVAATLRPPSAYAFDGNGATTKTVLLRLRLRGFDAPNFVQWGPGVFLRISAPMIGSSLALGRFDFRGPRVFTSGPVLLLSPLRMDFTSESLPVAIQLALRGGAHVHLAPTLSAKWGLGPRACPELPNFDPRYGGTCLDRVPSIGPVPAL